MRLLANVNVRAVVAEDIKELAQKFKTLNLFRQVVVVVSCLLTLGLPPWLHYMNEQWTTEMQYLYGQAMVGDRESVSKMAHHLWGTSWLESLALNRDAFAVARADAIHELADKKFISRKPLIPLIWIEQSFAVRHEAALLFLKKGCDEECVGMALRCLHSLHAGRPTFEARDLSSKENDLILQLWAQSEKDYLDLLNSDPCLSGMSLRSKYASDHSFIADVEGSLRVCTSRGGT